MRNKLHPYLTASIGLHGSDNQLKSKHEKFWNLWFPYSAPISVNHSFKFSSKYQAWVGSSLVCRILLPKRGGAFYLEIFSFPYCHPRNMFGLWVSKFPLPGRQLHSMAMVFHEKLRLLKVMACSSVVDCLPHLCGVLQKKNFLNLKNAKFSQVCWYIPINPNSWEKERAGPQIQG